MINLGRLKDTIQFGSYLNSLIKNNANLNEQFVGNVKEYKITKTQMKEQNKNEGTKKNKNRIRIRFNSINPIHQTNAK